MRHTEIVDLSQRLDYIIDHYSRGNDQIQNRIKANFDRCVELENYLFSFLPFEPGDLVERVNTAPFSVS